MSRPIFYFTRLCYGAILFTGKHLSNSSHRFCNDQLSYKLKLKVTTLCVRQSKHRNVLLRIIHENLFF